MKFVGRNFLLASFKRFAYSAAAMSLSDKWRPPFDSACSKGAEIPLQGVLTVGGDGVEGGEDGAPHRDGTSHYDVICHRDVMSHRDVMPHHNGEPELCNIPSR